ncbi:GntR family transcriptional regulator [Amycolatopsis rubida]|uniref:GntR family transcriptional regulator n=1 Tax=Amycolatopsis rubida TaxID=112413 RepID=A0ABX0C6N9_9PSEU|nr:MULTISPECIES: GntR family transcriptional regulator [Amycolatopsis]MYW97827.1 FCD domain-containing protein [Amycolatopsis rubida]NEC62813.1 GntR family transcriptional regulator [Amycolatopsis rubida]OAP24051.1 transcriptional regulator NanR [Amycolatopsis sp. M39]
MTIDGLGAGIQRRSTAEQAAEAVRQAILSVRLPPGTPLRETALAAELGVSRGTLREAARTLESEGLVRYQMNRGIVVADVTGPDVADIYAARISVELTAADALTEHRDPAIYRKLADLVDRIEHAFDQDDTATALDSDRLFHATLVTATGSPRLRRFHAQLQQEQRLALALAERSRRELGRTTDDHRRLLDALHGSPSEASAEITAHLRAGAAELGRLLDLLADHDESEKSRG